MVSQWCEPCVVFCAVQAPAGLEEALWGPADGKGVLVSNSQGLSALGGLPVLEVEYYFLSLFSFFK